MQTVLLVEDDIAVRTVVRHMLVRSGYKVLEAAGAEHALKLSSHYRPRIDVLITDVVLPRAGCQRLVEQTVRERPGVKVIYISGYPEDMLVRYGLAKPGTNFIQKPFTAEKLSLLIRAVLTPPDEEPETATQAAAS